MDEGKGSDLARECRREIMERFKKGKVVSEWERERKKFHEKRG